MIAFLTLELHIEAAQSLKDKRQVVRSLKDRLRASFNVSVAEVQENDKWQVAVLGIVTVSNDKTHANEMLSKIVNFIESDGEARLENYRIVFF